MISRAAGSTYCQPGEEFTFTEPTTLKWIAVDIKGNVSEVQTRLFGQGCTDLSLTKTGPSGRAPTGRNMTYTLTVTNGRPETASDVVLAESSATIDIVVKPTVAG